MTDGLPISDLPTLIAQMQPEQHPGAFVFATIPPPSKTQTDEGKTGIHLSDSILLRKDVVASFRESEGLTVVVAEATAAELGLEVLLRTAWITLRVHSALEAVGLTHAVSAALTQKNIPCNIVAAAYHDHLFVPVDKADQAMEVLLDLQRDSG